jgi:hypothetical protein
LSLGRGQLEDSTVPFKVQVASVDLMQGSANLVAFDNAIQPAKVVNVQFPFTPPHSEGKEKDAVIAEAKKVLQQALNEI